MMSYLKDIPSGLDSLSQLAVARSYNGVRLLDSFGRNRSIRGERFRRLSSR